MWKQSTWSLITFFRYNTFKKLAIWLVENIFTINFAAGIFENKKFVVKYIFQQNSSHYLQENTKDKNLSKKRKNKLFSTYFVTVLAMFWENRDFLKKILLWPVNFDFDNVSFSQINKKKLLSTFQATHLPDILSYGGTEMSL